MGRGPLKYDCACLFWKVTVNHVLEGIRRLFNKSVICMRKGWDLIFEVSLYLGCVHVWESRGGSVLTVALRDEERREAVGVL